MSREAEIISKSQLNKFKITLNRLKNDLVDDQLFEDVLEVLSSIGKNKIYQLQDDVYLALGCIDPIIRAKAVATLGYGMRLHLPEFRDQAYQIFLNDPDPNVKRTSLSAWSSYYINTNDKEVLKILYKILLDQNNTISIRTEAYANIFGICKNRHPAFDPFHDDTALLKSKTHEEFNSKVNWSAIEEIMREHSPDALENKKA